MWERYRALRTCGSKVDYDWQNLMQSADQLCQPFGDPILERSMQPTSKCAAPFPIETARVELEVRPRCWRHQKEVE